jgi:hypothetical protein
MATKKASTPKATDETAVKKTVTRRKRTVKKAVEEPAVVMESVVEVTSEVPTDKETTQDSSVHQGPVIARPTYFTGSIDELNAAIQQAAQQNQSGFDNGLQNPALGIQQQQPVQTTIPFPVTPVMETKVTNPAAMGSEQKAALEQQIQSQPIEKKEEVSNMTKQENLDKVNETKMDQQATKEESLISAALANKIADKIAEENKKDDNKLFDAVIEGMLVGTAAGVGVVAGSYAADKAITAFEEWRNNKDKAEEATKLVSGLL